MNEEKNNIVEEREAFVASEVKKLVRERTQAQNHIRKILNDLRTLDNEVSRSACAYYIEELNKYNGIIEHKSLEIASLLEDQENEEKQNDIIMQWYDQVSTAIIMLRGMNQLMVSIPINPPQQQQHTESVSSAVRLPQFNLPSFSGDYEEWNSFSDLFRTLIESNASLTKAQRLQYLKSCLKGEPEQLIRSYQISDENYELAWSTLKVRYDNKREIIHSILKRLVGIMPMKSESASELQKVVDTTQEAIRSLNCLKVPVNQWDEILVYLTVEKLDSETKRQWAKTLTGTEYPKLDNLFLFLEQQIRGLVASGSVAKESDKPYRRDNKKVHHVSTTMKCYKCGESHPVYACPQFKESSVESKWDLVKKERLCFMCFSSKHGSRDCSSKRICGTCGKNHNTMLHTESKSRNEESTVATLHTTGTKKQVLLSTLLVKVKNGKGEYKVARALYDNGSQSSFISYRLAKLLGLELKRANVSITGVESARSSATSVVNLNVSSRVNNNFNMNLNCFVLKNITGLLPSFKCDNLKWSHLSKLSLADPKYFEPSSVDILLGADVTSHILLSGIRRGSKDAPIAINTRMGWIVQGPIGQGTSEFVHSLHAQCQVNDILQRFWEIEEIPNVSQLTDEERACEKHFELTHKRDSSGRYIVKIPFKSNLKFLGESKTTAERRLVSIEKRLEKCSEHKEQYVKFMREYEELGHMEVIENESVVPRECYYMPHHFVLKGDSTSTKLRVVFDASCKSSSGLSLNDCMMVGPTIQDDLFSLIMRFRLKPIALKADITKMYRQFLVDESNRNYQRIVWRESPSQPIKSYKLNTVTYGTASAPYLATKCLQRLCDDESETHPLASKALRNDAYVDDLISGSETVESTKQLYSELVSLNQKAGMEIRKWVTNNKELLNFIPIHLQENNLYLNFGITNDCFKTLGIQWDPNLDNFIFSAFPQSATAKALTKRILLSELAKVFDPLGWLAPVTIRAKIVFQDLWKRELAWDDILPVEVQREWNEYLDELVLLKEIKIPRCIVGKSEHRLELVGFCDASEKAYSAVVYMRCITTVGNNVKISANLLAAKTRVAPVKQVSLPKLELCGALHLVRLVKLVRASLKINCAAHLFSDSEIVLHWLDDFPSRWKTFVANRVAEIQENFPIENWSHVKSEENPADLPTRGISSRELVNSKLWWNGPYWMSSTEEISHKKVENKDLELPEERDMIIHNFHNFVEEELLVKVSSILKLKRITAYCLRFINNYVKKEKVSGPLTALELESALMVWVKKIQNVYYNNEICLIMKNSHVPKSSFLGKLNPYVENGILRVGGRLNNSDLCEDEKHPIILPPESKLTHLLIESYHKENLHAGLKLVWSSLNQRFWISSRAKQTIKMILNKCVKCRRIRACKMEQLMSSLPKARVSPTRPFLHAGVDYAGPYFLKASSGRGKKSYKGYIALFVCFSTKALHLEAVSDLSTQAFLAAFKRFISRRGISSHMYSDNGTNFVGADKELKKLFESKTHNEEVGKFLSNKGITWIFNSPSAPHHGGLWEAGVKSIKFHLKRVLGTVLLTFEEFQTVLCEIEACVNSRPLCALSADVTDLSALTPGHFLIGEPLNAIPEPDLTMVSMNRLTQWQRVQELSQRFWKRWHLEYLPTLQQRVKWIRKGENLREGDLVVIREDNSPPSNWKLGRVEVIHPGSDGVVRVATVRTATGKVIRPIVKLVLLLEDDCK